MKTIIAIDDSRIALAQIERITREILPEIRFLKTQNVDEGIALIKENVSDLLFLLVDYNMEGKNGTDVIKEVIHLLDPGRISLVTANTQSSVMSEARDLGINFIGKDELKLRLPDLLAKVA